MSARAVLIVFNVIQFPALNPGLKASGDLQLLLWLWAFTVSIALIREQFLRPVPAC